MDKQQKGVEHSSKSCVQQWGETLVFIKTTLCNDNLFFVITVFLVEYYPGVISLKVFSNTTYIEVDA